MKKNIYKILGLILILSVNTSCINDLDTEPEVDLTLEQILANDPNAVEGLVSRIYSTFALSSVKGAGQSDISGADPGESPFIRGLVNLQDFTADGMKNRWGDNGLDQLTTTSGWSPNNKFFKYVYDRVYYIVPQSTNIILTLDRVNVSNKEQTQSELRFLRSLAYYYLIDLFGKGPLVTNDTYNSTLPLKEATRTELFNYVEAELLDIETKLPQTNTYGRATQAAAQMLLAKLYMNAQVYTGTQRYNDATTYLNKVIASSFSLESNYKLNFSANNNTSKEIIFPLIADALTSQSFGNTTYIVNGSLSTETMTLTDFGASEGWAGHRATKAWYGLFGSSVGSLNSSTDIRAKLFWTGGHNWEMDDYKNWADGLPSIKFTNKNADGSGTATQFSSTDFPLFRLSDAYLMYAECALRGANGASMAQALTYVNDVRTRSGAGAISSSALNLDFILDERGRELNLEGMRRQDLIRFGKFTGSSYLWPWKGGVKNGVSIPSTYNLFPIPTSALQANLNLTQNPGY